jgi:hypothetical protein
MKLVLTLGLFLVLLHVVGPAIAGATPPPRSYFSTDGPVLQVDGPGGMARVRGFMHIYGLSERIARIDLVGVGSRATVRWTALEGARVVGRSRVLRRGERLTLVRPQSGVHADGDISARVVLLPAPPPGRPPVPNPEHGPPRTAAPPPALRLGGFGALHLSPGLGWCRVALWNGIWGQNCTHKGAPRAWLCLAGDRRGRPLIRAARKASLCPHAPAWATGPKNVPRRPSP